MTPGDRVMVTDEFCDAKRDVHGICKHSRELFRGKIGVIKGQQTDGSYEVRFEYAWWYIPAKYLIPAPCAALCRPTSSLTPLTMTYAGKSETFYRASEVEKLMERMGGMK